MTNAEKQEIIEAVLAALATNSKTIAQLSPKQSLTDGDLFEVAGGSRVTYQMLKSLIREGLALESRLSDYLTEDAAMMYLAKLDTETGTVDYKESPLVMLDGFKGVNGYTPVTGDLYYENYYGFQIWIKRAGGDNKEGIVANPNVAYVNKNDGAIYRWTGSSMVRIGGSAVINDLVTGGEADALSAEQGKVLKGLIDNIGTGSIAAFSQYAVFESVSALPATGVATTGYIVGTHIYAYVGTGGDTRDGKYQDLGALEAAGVSVTTAEDGTFTIHAGGNDYTVNLNHTHPNMCKLVVCEESGLPSTLDNDTIYAITDSGETEIEKLIIRGMEFAGGGVPDTGEPMISSPSNGSTINLGTNEGSGVSKTITIKGKNLTGDLTVSVGSGLKLRYGQAIDASTVTIPVAQALLGAQVTISYTGSSALDDGSLVIRQGNDVLSSVVVVVVVPQPIGVKLTGTQWLQTDYYPNANTEFELVCKFTDKGNTSLNNGYFLTCANNSDTTEKFQIAFSQNKWQLWYTAKNNPNAQLNFSASADQANFVLDNSVLSFVKGASNGTFKFVPGGDESKAKSVQTTLMNYTMQNPLRIGRGNTYFFELFELTIYELTITENGTAVRHYVPKNVNGVPGLYDTVTDTFISSETSTEVEEVYANS